MLSGILSGITGVVLELAVLAIDAECCVEYVPGSAAAAVAAPAGCIRPCSIAVCSFMITCLHDGRAGSA
jgi:hypothetical protein